MVLKHLKKGLNIGIKHMELTSKQIQTELKPLVKAGELTAKDAKAFAVEVEKVGRKNRDRIEQYVLSEAAGLIKKLGYDERRQYDALKKKLAEKEKKAKKSKKRK
jgi:polyhydroxyalkanoate synthesis regulator phasin